MSAILNVATKAAYAAASLIQRRSSTSIAIEKKPGITNFVTEYDKNAEKIIISTIKKAFPEHNILAEESGLENSNAEFTWIIDPIDGTTNFIHNHPQYCISIAVKQKDKIICGVILDPNRNDLYHATIGAGAFLNDKRLRVSKTSYLEDSLIGTGFPTYDQSNLDIYLAILKDMLKNTSGHRRCGAAALDLAFVAAGYLDGFWEFNLKPWDIAAGILLVKEAGGIITTFSENEDLFTSGNIIAANPKIAPELAKIIRHHLNKTSKA